MQRIKISLDLNDEQLKQLDERLKQVGFKNRSEYLRACSMILEDGIDPFEWNRTLRDICDNKNVMQKTFFEILDERFFPIIAMKGTKAVISGNILTDIKREILNRCDMLPEDSDLEKWLDVYKYINLAKLAEHRARVTKERFEEEEEDNA